MLSDGRFFCPTTSKIAMKALLPIVISAFTLTGIASAQIRINEVGVDHEFMGQTEWVELYNEGSSAVDVSSWYLCNFPAYPQIGNVGETTVLAGNTTIQPGEYLVVTFAALDTTGAEVGIYTTNSDFADPGTMVDYMEYITVGFRESVAVTAGVWTTGNPVTQVPAGKTYSWFGGGSQGVRRLGCRGSDSGCLKCRRNGYRRSRCPSLVHSSWKLSKSVQPEYICRI